ncbi:PEP-CTERM/exosortase system-associated acyltransferase [Halieaceae bacterium IMCC14734]|uniref:PEP-CTERM/exosortase system-associated acyltransferase n=1 Tax=Candidatus Litorirhabdus singularis TaxID=2518993 RepID=A0ABT3TG61_9GAMM|nr:PEP-CTERM/exosortase system-associated acyltransferase [Candidatus Litorirhabdus singularis]
MAFTPLQKQRVLSRQTAPDLNIRGRAGETVQQQPPKNSTESLAENFQQYFAAELSHTNEQLLAVYKVRYRVYCEEFAYEPAQSFTDREEKDEFDGHSLHCLMTHRSSEQPAGCVRVVAPGNDQITPMEKYCMDSIDPAFHQYLYDDRERMCEFSRLAVDAAFRRRPGESVTRFGQEDALDVSRKEQRTFSLIAVAAFLGAFAISDITGRTNVFAMMEPFLPRLLRRSGITVHRAGSDIDYHGTRAAYFATTEEVLAGMNPELKALYDAIHRRFAATYGKLPDLH